MYYFIIILLSINSVFAQLGCLEITEQLENLNQAQLAVQHISPMQTAENYNSYANKSLSEYIEILGSEETTSEERKDIIAIIKELSEQHEMMELKTLQKYYAQQFLKETCNKENLTQEEFVHKSMCEKVLSVFNKDQINFLTADVGKVLMQMSLQNQVVTSSDLEPICKRNKKVETISAACSMASIASVCPKKTELVEKKCSPICDKTQIREESAPYQCKSNPDLVLAYKQQKAKNRAAWGNVAKIGAVIGIAGGVATLAAWGISELWEPKEQVITHKYQRDYNYNKYNYNITYPQYPQQRFDPYSMYDYNYGYGANTSGQNTTSYWTPTDVYSFGF